MIKNAKITTVTNAPSANSSIRNLTPNKKTIMSWFKKSKYKKPKWNWWDDYGYQDTQGNGGVKDDVDDYGYGYGRTGTGLAPYSYTPSWYKPKYDMSVSLETRVTQLIQTITGKRLKLAQAEGWGSDEEYFYYNGEDLRNISDDEVLGRILQQLAKEMYIDKGKVGELNAREAAYRHLLDTLEANRSDRQLQSRYGGVRYYSEELWNSRKFTENPMSKYTEAPKFEDWLSESHGDSVVREYKKGRFDNRIILELQTQYQQYVQSLKGQQNDSWEFCFNINAFQNSETQFDFTKDQMAANFEKALPYIDQYLKATTWDEAMAAYPQIQKYYPPPTQSQQQQMDNGMQGMAGLSQQQMAMLKAQMQQSGGKGGRGNGTSQVDAAEEFGIGHFDKDGNYIDGNGQKGSLNDGKRIIEPLMAEYKRLAAQNAGTTAALHALIRSILKDNEIKRYQRPFKRGKIDAKRMYKYIAADDLRIFKKQRQINQKKYTMAIMVDQSGSMSGSNSSYAIQAAIVLAEVFDMLGLPFEILGFDNTTYVFKSYNKFYNRALMPSLKDTGGGTDDHNALRVLLEHTKQFDPTNHYRKGFFVISDGEGADPNAMKALVTEIEGHHNATVFGIGIGSMKESSLKQSYNTWLRVGNVGELPNTLVGIMRGQFRRG